MTGRWEQQWNMPRKLAAPGAIAVPNATNELARVDARRRPDHEVTPMLPARTGEDLPGSTAQFSQYFSDFYFAAKNILASECKELNTRFLY
jgi:hypothetical protein